MIIDVSTVFHCTVNKLSVLYIWCGCKFITFMVMGNHFELFKPYAYLFTNQPSMFRFNCTKTKAHKPYYFCKAKQHIHVFQRLHYTQHPTFVQSRWRPPSWPIVLKIIRELMLETRAFSSYHRYHLLYPFIDPQTRIKILNRPTEKRNQLFGRKGRYLLLSFDASNGR